MRKQSKALNSKAAIIGAIVGDALGVPAEFSTREERMLEPITDMVGYGAYDLPLGTWSDDSSMLWATIDSLNNHKLINYEDMMQCFCNWFNISEYTPYGKVFDIGVATRKSLMNALQGHQFFRVGREVSLIMETDR